MRRGVITFVFDDGYEHIYSDIVPLLESHSMRGVFAIPLESAHIQQTTNLPTKSWQDWKHIESRGHEIAAHSISHTDLTTCDAAKLLKELQEPAQTLNAKTLIYPGGAYNEAVLTEVKKLYSAARTAKRGFNPLPPTTLFELNTWNFTRDNFTVFKANMLAVWAYLTNSWLIETYHIVSDDAPADIVHAISKKDFIDHIKFVSRLPLRNKTISDVIS